MMRTNPPGRTVRRKPLREFPVPVVFILVALLAAAFPGVTAHAQEIVTTPLDPQADYPVGGVLAELQGGGFVAAWSRGIRLSFGVDQVAPGEPVAVWMSPEGDPLSPVRTLREDGEPLTTPVALGSVRAGEALVVLTGDDPQVVARRISQDGSLGPAWTIEACAQAQSFELESNGPTGYFLLCGGRVQRLASDGQPAGAPIVLAPPELGPADARGATTADGDLWVVWTQDSFDGRGAFVRRLGPGGAAETPVSLVARVGAGTFGSPRIDVAALPEGGAAVVWAGAQGLVRFRLVNREGTFDVAETGFLGPVGEGPASAPRVVASRNQGLLAFSWREPVGGGSHAAAGYLRLVPVATGRPGNAITIDHGFAASLLFDARDRLAVLALEPRLLDFNTYLSPRFGLTPLATLMPPPGDGVVSDAFPGFRFWVRIGGDEPDPRIGTLEPLCQPETACFSGSLPGRSEVEVRIVGPKPNGYLWPNVVRFTTSQVEVWIEQIATGERRYYLLDGVDPESNELDGLFDRFGFLPR